MRKLPQRNANLEVDPRPAVTVHRCPLRPHRILELVSQIALVSVALLEAGQKDFVLATGEAKRTLVLRRSLSVRASGGCQSTGRPGVLERGSGVACGLGVVGQP